MNRHMTNLKSQNAMRKRETQEAQEQHKKRKKASMFAFEFFAFCFALFVFPFSTAAQDASATPGILGKVGFDQKLDAQLPLDLIFRDESGRASRLGDYFGDKPVILSLIYYDCPMLCTMSLNGLVNSLSDLRFDVGR